MLIFKVGIEIIKAKGKFSFKWKKNCLFFFLLLCFLNKEKTKKKTSASTTWKFWTSTQRTGRILKPTAAAEERRAEDPGPSRREESQTRDTSPRWAPHSQPHLHLVWQGIPFPHRTNQPPTGVLDTPRVQYQ